MSTNSRTRAMERHPIAAPLSTACGCQGCVCLSTETVDTPKGRRCRACRAGNHRRSLVESKMYRRARLGLERRRITSVDPEHAGTADSVIARLPERVLRRSRERISGR